VSQLTVNSKYYSAKPPPRIRTATLPHVTIQCPVYKEGLDSVIAPTVKSIKQAISTYELQGGTANIFINDDGLQLLSAEDRQARIDFYADHNIGWVARPKHGENGFLRRGKFKKVREVNRDATRRWNRVEGVVGFFSFVSIMVGRLAYWRERRVLIICNADPCQMFYDYYETS
jgi:hypothetical protein